MLGKIEGRRRRGATEDELIGWSHLLNRHEFEQTLGDSEGQGSLVCCSQWGCEESDMTKQLKNNNKFVYLLNTGLFIKFRFLNFIFNWMIIVSQCCVCF